MTSGYFLARKAILTRNSSVSFFFIELNIFMDRAYHLSMSRIYLSVPADRIVAAAAFVRGVPEEEEEEEEEDDQEEDEEDDDEGEGYSE
jgi:hypothetical protein